MAPVPASSFLDFFEKISVRNRFSGEDFADRLNLFTVVLFLIACVIVSAKQYVLNSLSCYIPVEPSGSDYTKFTADYCWVHGTIPLRPNEPMPGTPEEWERYDQLRRITYYQWVPFVLGLQCILFYLPHIVWQSVSTNRSGGDLFQLVKLTSKASVSDRESRQKQVNAVAEFLEDMLGVHHDCRRGRRAGIARQAYNSCGCCVVSKRMGTCLVWCYIGIKLLALVNAILQIVVIQYFLGFYPEGSVGQHSAVLGEMTDPKTITVYDPAVERISGLGFGLTVLRHIWSGRDWPETLLFPRVAYCRVPGIRVVGGENSYTAQCALPINMLNEKIYIFFWFWIVFLIATIVTSMILWFSFMVRTPRRKDLVKRFLRLKNILAPGGQMIGREDLDEFTDEYLRRDGIFIIRMLALNAGEIITADVVAKLYLHYRENAYPAMEGDIKTFNEKLV